MGCCLSEARAEVLLLAADKALCLVCNRAVSVRRSRVMHHKQCTQPQSFSSRPPSISIRANRGTHRMLPHVLGPFTMARRWPSLAVNFREVVHSVRTGNPDVAKPQRFAEDRMDTHKNARLTPKGREEMVRAVADRGMSKAAAAHQFNTTPKTVGKWVDRFCAEGVDGLRDLSSRPLSSPNQIPLAT